MPKHLPFQHGSMFQCDGEGQCGRALVVYSCHGHCGAWLVVVHEHALGAEALQKLHFLEERAAAPWDKHHRAPDVVRVKRDVLTAQILFARAPKRK